MIPGLLRRSTIPMLLLVACSGDQPTSPRTPDRAGVQRLGSADAQSLSTYLVGAYYFSGWWRDPSTPVLGLGYFPGHYIHNYPRSPMDWREEYPEREPVTGWFDDRQKFVDNQIRIAAEGKIDFFAFEYFPEREDAREFPGSRENNNNGLDFFKTSPYKGLMQFALLYVNSGRFAITERDEWRRYVRKWVRDNFTDPQYLKIDGKPVFLLINAPGLIPQWGSESNVKERLQELRNETLKAGFPGVLIGGGITRASPAAIEKVSDQGFDFLTSFNAGFGDPDPAEGQDACPVLPNGANPYSRLMHGDEKVGPDYMKCRWNLFTKGPLPYAPVVVQGWDRRPVGKAGGDCAPDAPPDPREACEPYLVEKTTDLFKEQLGLAKDFVHEQATRFSDSFAARHGMVLIYAWNEIGEGGHLIPNQAEGEKSEYLNTIGEVFH